MQRRVERRFIFTQLSAIPIFFGAMIGVILLVLRPLLRLFEIRLDAPAVLDVRLIVVIVLFSIALSIAAILAFCAGRLFLVWIGLLSAEEAQGYPYSKPWER